jgi:hypothetical protein
LETLRFGAEKQSSTAQKIRLGVFLCPFFAETAHLLDHAGRSQCAGCLETGMQLRLRVDRQDGSDPKYSAGGDPSQA